MRTYHNEGMIVDIGTVPGTNVTVQSSMQITGTFDLTGIPAGQYNVVVTNTNGQMAVLPNGFTVTNQVPPAVPPELHITGPLSPGQPVPYLENATIRAADLFLASGSTIEHRTNSVTYIIRPNGTELGWAYDNETKQFNTATGPVLGSYVHIIPQGSVIVPLPNNGGVLIGNRSAEAPALKTINRNVIGAGSSSLPDVVCSPELLGCRVGMSSQNEQFLSDPLIATGGYIPAFSLQSICDNLWLGSLSKLGSASPADISVLIMDKTLTNPDQPIYFNLSSSNWTQGSEQNLYLTAKATLVNQSSGLQYTITGTSSAPVQMNITPHIWQTTDAGDELVFTGTPMLCTSATSCIAAGNFTPIGNATYFANATVLYTGSTTLAAAGEGVVGVVMAPGTVRVATNTIDYYVFSDGVNKYHGFEKNTDLYGPVPSSQNFYKHMDGTVGSRCHEYNNNNYCWNGRKNPVDDDTGSKYWSKSEVANSEGANSAQFAYHAGHGWDDGILFGTANKFNKMYRTDMEFSKAKWVVLSSCDVLNKSTQDNWESVFKGVHIVMSFDTHGIVDASQGPMFAERMRGGTYNDISYPVTKISTAWQRTLEDTIHDDTLKGAYMYAEPSQDDYLAGYGDFKEPTKTNGEYTIKWTNFKCKSQ